MIAPSIDQGVAARGYGSLAQLVEQLTFNQLVAGSIPARPTSFAGPSRQRARQTRLKTNRQCVRCCASEDSALPIYEYECKDCGHRLEKLQQMTDDPLRHCPACASAGLQRLISAVAFRLKGSGWYETDFKEKQSRKNLANGDDPPKRAEGDKDKAARGKQDRAEPRGAADKTKRAGAGDTAAAPQAGG